MKDVRMNLFDLIKLFWAGKLTIIISALVGCLLAFCIILLLPNKYQSTVVVAPTDNNDSQRSSINDSIASITGVTASPGSVMEIDLVLEILQSRKFILDFVERHKLKIPLMAIKGWDQRTDELIYDPDIYLLEKEEWNIAELKKNRIPTSEEVYDEFRGRLSIVTDPKTGIIEISFKSPSPKLSRQWLEMFINDINAFKRNQDIEKSDSRIKYLQTQLLETNVAEIKNIFFDLIQEELKTRLLAKTRDDYSLSIIDPATESDLPVSPNKALIFVIGLLLGSFIGLLIEFCRFSYKEYQGNL
ncbi:MAG: Wzz/FepE/Etk N-terminal domain-containing protein [Emcibacteraceae bacterium]